MRGKKGLKQGAGRGSTVKRHQIRAISSVQLAFGETVITATFFSARVKYQ